MNRPFPGMAIPKGFGSTAGVAIAAATVSSGFLFMARGGYMPYFFPLYEGVSGLGYARIAILLNVYLAANSIGSPFVGLLVDRLQPKLAVALALTINAVTYLLAITIPLFWSLLVSVTLLGATFTMGRVAFNKILISHSNDDTLRRSVSIRAMLMTGGSFAGNIVAALFAKGGHATAQLTFVYAVLLAAWSISTIGISQQVRVEGGSRPPFWKLLPAALANRPFLLDLGRLFTALLPYGCWGTIIPKFVFDRFHDASLIPTMYAFSTVTIVGLTYVFNQTFAAWLHGRGFRRTTWPYVAAILFLLGLIAIANATNIVLLGIGAVAFGLGEVVFTPCMDEAVKRNSDTGSSGTYIGLVQLTEGGARLLGSALSLTVYGFLQSTDYAQWTWATIIVAFTTMILISTAAIAFFVRKGNVR